MGLQDINSMYDNLLNSKLNQLKQKRAQAIQGYETQNGQVENDYNNVVKGLNDKVNKTKSLYQNLYSELDQENDNGKQKFYQQRNTVDVGVNQNLDRIRELMAKNGWTQGGENLQAQLSANTNRMNGLGEVASNEANFITNLSNQKNKYVTEEQSVYNDVNTQTEAANQNKIKKLADIAAAIKLIEENGTLEDDAARNEVESSRIRDVNSYNERLRQEELQKQQAEAQRIYEEKQREIAYQRELEQQAAQRAWQEQEAEKEYQRQLAMQREQQAASLRAASVRSSSSSSSASQKASKDQYSKEAWSEFEKSMRSGMAEEFLNDNAEAIMDKVSPAEYYKMVDRFEKARYGTSTQGKYNRTRLNTRKQEETYNKMYEV